MSEFEYIKANDLDRAWLNFELDLPLEPGIDGGPNPFYVDPPGNPAVRLERELLREYRNAPKYFFSGHRGCGKSTELRRLAVNPKIIAKYWPIHFSIRDETDINNLDFKDILFAIGGRLFREYRKKKRKLPKKLMEELEGWRGQVQSELKTIISGRTKESEIGAGIDAFFAKASVKMKIEPATRHEMRQVFERNLVELVTVIDKIAIAISDKEKRPPLILVDDLDKPDLDTCRDIFYGHRETMLQLNVPIIYTVASSLFYSPDFHAIRNRAIFLPSVKLHEQGKPDTQDSDGYRTLRMFVQKRMRTELISDDALNQAIHVSGGLFREMARVMRSAIDYASVSDQAQVNIDHVNKAEAEIRGEYRRFLTREQRKVLRAVRNHNQYDEPEKVAPLLQILAILEYSNGEPWCDTHPALNKLLDETDDEDDVF